MKEGRIYMTGIGGIGMSALAQLLAHDGRQVSGSDRDESPTTELLEQKGITVSIGQRAENVPADTELLIYSDAVPADNSERMRAAELGIRQLSYFEALGEVSKGMRTIAVSGTHGKTTTTGMLAKILQAAGKEPTAIIGSIVRDFESNYLPGRNDLLVVEACEYRDHLLKLSPEILVITILELDHTDYFPNLEAIQASFRKAVAAVPSHGAIIANPNDPNTAAVFGSATAKIIDYTKLAVPQLNQIGEFNRKNAQAAKAAALAAFPDLSEEAIDAALSVFHGSWRRFEYKGETPNGALVYDDYGHHPTAMRVTVEAAREKFPDKKIVVVFHPHLYSRTKSFLHEFAEELAKADEAIVAPIYAAREEPDPAISNHALAAEAAKLGGNVRALDSFDAIRNELLALPTDALIITMGAGDIYKVADQIVEARKE